MICEHCKEETGIGAPHAYEGKTGVWACPSLPPEEREPWQAIRIVQAENGKLNGEILQYRSRLEEESKRAVDAEAERDTAILQVDAVKAAEAIAVEQHNLADVEVKALKLQVGQLTIERDAARQTGMELADKMGATVRLNDELLRILADAKGMFTHGSSLSGTHASILYKAIQEFDKRHTGEKRSLPVPKPGPRCDHGEICVIHQCADCGEKIDFV